MALFKKNAKQQEVVEPPLILNAGGKAPQPELQAREIAARQNPAMVVVKELLYDALARRAEKVMLDYTRDMVAGRYLIDGVWHNIDPRDRETGDGMLFVLKTLGGLKPDERRARQSGEFKIEHEQTRTKFNGSITSQGVQTGERVILELAPKKAKEFKTLDDIGMRDALQEKLREQLRNEDGIVLVSAPPGGGFTTTWNCVLMATDRFLRDFVCIEDKQAPETTAENVNVTHYDSAAGETPDKKIRSVMLKQPDALVLPDLVNAETVKQACDLSADEHRLIIGGVKAKEAVEALLRVLLLKAPARDFAEQVRAVVNVRLIRKLNDTCKQPFQPPPQLLQKLGIPPGRVKVMYREWQPPPPDPEEAQGKKQKEPPLPPGACPLCKQVGPHCGGLGYYGRTGIFEVLEVTDKLREALVKKPKLEVLRKVARAGGHRGLQDEGVLLVAKGVTSLTELQRVMK